MLCPSCGRDSLRVTHTIPAGEEGEARNYKCLECLEKCSSVTFLVRREGLHRGRGARALAKKLVRLQIRYQEG